MSDLISRSAFIDMLLAENQKCITSTGHELTISMVVSFINNAPTAYDISKVVAELESKRDYKTIDNYYGETIGAIEIRSIDIGEAIEIVKAGGVE